MTDGKVFYLAGCIAGETDGGMGWRDQLTPKLKSLGHDVRDPTKKYSYAKDSLEALQHYHQAKMEMPYEVLRSYSAVNIVNKDLDLINECDGIIALFQKKNGAIKYGVGTSSELFYNRYCRGKTNYVILDGASLEDLVMNVSAFLIYCADGGIYRSVEDFLEALANGRTMNKIRLIDPIRSESDVEKAIQNAETA